MQYREALAAVSDGVWEWDIETGKAFFDDNWKWMLGLSPQEVVGERSEWFSRVHPEDLPRVQGDLQKHLENPQKPYRSEHRLQCSTGEWKWILDRGRLVEWTPEGLPKRMVGTHLDIDAFKAQEEKLSLQEEALKRLLQREKESSRSKELFLSNMSHELRTPLTSILGNAAFMLNARNDTFDRSRLRTIATAGKVLLGHLENILQIANLEEGQIQAETKRFCLKHFFLDIHSLFAEESAKRQIPLIIEVNPETDSHVFQDFELLKQIVFNLVSNAFKYSNNGSVRVQVEQKITLQKKHLVIQVKDEGIGMHREFLPHLFNKFSRCSRQVGVTKGTGLGLTISHHLALLLGGRIEANSTLGKGSEFVLWVPCRLTTVNPVSRICNQTQTNTDKHRQTQTNTDKY